MLHQGDQSKRMWCFLKIILIVFEFCFSNLIITLVFLIILEHPVVNSIFKKIFSLCVPPQVFFYPYFSISFFFLKLYSLSLLTATISHRVAYTFASEFTIRSTANTPWNPILDGICPCRLSGLILLCNPKVNTRCIHYFLITVMYFNHTKSAFT